jgi:hypothetical protein
MLLGLLVGGKGRRLTSAIFGELTSTTAKVTNDLRPSGPLNTDLSLVHKLNIAAVQYLKQAQPPTATNRGTRATRFASVHRDRSA